VRRGAQFVPIGMLTVLKNTSTEEVVNQKLEYLDVISFRELFGRIRMVFFNYKARFVPS
jgi:hypothetical protein